jgi:hypothetical protein
MAEDGLNVFFFCRFSCCVPACVINLLSLPFTISLYLAYRDKWQNLRVWKPKSLSLGYKTPLSVWVIFQWWKLKGIFTKMLGDIMIAHFCFYFLRIRHTDRWRRFHNNGVKVFSLSPLNEILVIHKGDFFSPNAWNMGESQKHCDERSLKECIYMGLDFYCLYRNKCYESIYCKILFLI